MIDGVRLTAWPERQLCDCTDPPHVANCPTCFGFGLHENGVPRVADCPPGPICVCPTCGTAVNPEPVTSAEDA